MTPKTPTGVIYTWSQVTQRTLEAIITTARSTNESSNINGLDNSATDPYLGLFTSQSASWMSGEISSGIYSQVHLPLIQPNLDNHVWLTENVPRHSNILLFACYYVVD